MDDERKKQMLSITNNDKTDSSMTTPDKNPWNKLDDVMVETVLARLPTIDILHCRFVCKSWESIIRRSPSFPITSKQLFNRRPWFFMFSSSSRSSSTSVVYDMEVSDWRHVPLRVPTTTIATYTGRQEKVKTIPVASSGGLICFDKSATTDYYSFIVNNPITGASRSLPDLQTHHRKLKGVAMHALKSESLGGSKLNYKIFLVFENGTTPNLVMKVFSSRDPEPKWIVLPLREVIVMPNTYDQFNWTLGKQLAAVTTLGNEGQILVHYLSRYLTSGRLICVDTQKGTFFISKGFGYNCENADLVECSGRVFCIALKNDLTEDNVRCKTLHVLEFNHKKCNWKQLKVLPLKWWKLHDEDTDKTMNCSGHGDHIMVCLNYYRLEARRRLNRVLMYNIKENTWTPTKLPPCLDPGYNIGIWSPYLFEPEIHAMLV